VRAPKLKAGREYIIKVTFDPGAYQGKVVGKGYLKVPTQRPRVIVKARAIATAKG
jgi:hypothetical protein